MRVVRRAEPHDRQKRLARRACANPIERGIHRDHRTLPLGLNSLTAVREDRIVVKKVRRADPFVKPVAPRVHGAVAAHRAQVPFAEMPGRIVGLVQRFGERHFLRTNRIAPLEHAHAIGMPAGHNAGPGRRTNRRRGVEAIESQTGRGRLVEVGRFEHRMTVVGHVAPALIVGHHQHDVRAFRPRRRATTRPRTTSAAFRIEFRVTARYLP